MTLHRPTTPLRRFAALAAMILFGASGLAEELHVALVRHVRCEVHGEWVHADEARGSAALDGVTVEASTTAEAAHTHDHCATAGDGKVELALTRVASVVRLEQCGSVGLGPTVSRAARVPLWALAPKSSPPVS